MAHGGLSTVWGAGVRLWSEGSIDRLGVDSNWIYAEARDLLSKMKYSGSNETLNFPERYSVEEKSTPPGLDLYTQIKSQNLRSKVKVFATPLAVSIEGENSCRGCGRCLSGCPYNSIFDSGLYFDQIFQREKVKSIVGVVDTLTESNGLVEVKYSAPNGTVENLVFDEVYLCAGAIGTPAILMRSGYLSTTIEVADSQVFYFIGLKKPSRTSKKNFALSQATLTSDETNLLKFSASLYLSNKDVRERISNLIASKLFGLRIAIPSFIDRFIFLGIGFLDSNHSGQMVLNRDKMTNELTVSVQSNPNSKHFVAQAVKSISRRLRSSGLFVLSGMVITPDPGEGFHSGASLPLGGKHVNHSGELRGAEHIHVSDVSTLPFIEPGAHTLTSMAFNSAVIKSSKK
jgi:ferredoxin